MPYIAEPTNTPVPFLVPSPLLSQFFVCFFVFALHLRTLSILLLCGFTIRCSMQDAVLLGLCHISLMDGKRSSGKKKKEKIKSSQNKNHHLLPNEDQFRSASSSSLLLFLLTHSLSSIPPTIQRAFLVPSSPALTPIISSPLFYCYLLPCSSHFWGSVYWTMMAEAAEIEIQRPLLIWEIRTKRQRMSHALSRKIEEVYVWI